MWMAKEAIVAMERKMDTTAFEEYQRGGEVVIHC